MNYPTTYVNHSSCVIAGYYNRFDGSSLSFFDFHDRIQSLTSMDAFLDLALVTCLIFSTICVSNHFTLLPHHKFYWKNNSLT